MQWSTQRLRIYRDWIALQPISTYLTGVPGFTSQSSGGALFWEITLMGSPCRRWVGPEIILMGPSPLFEQA